MNCIKPDGRAKKYRPHMHGGYVIQPHPNAASVPIYGVRRPAEHLMCAGPFATAKAAEAWVDEQAMNEEIERAALAGNGRPR